MQQQGGRFEAAVQQLEHARAQQHQNESLSPHCMRIQFTLGSSDFSTVCAAGEARMRILWSNARIAPPLQGTAIKRTCMQGAVEYLLDHPSLAQEESLWALKQGSEQHRRQVTQSAQQEQQALKQSIVASYAFSTDKPSHRPSQAIPWGEKKSGVGGQDSAGKVRLFSAADPCIESRQNCLATEWYKSTSSPEKTISYDATRTKIHSNGTTAPSRNS